MKKILSVLLILTFILSFASCGNKNAYENVTARLFEEYPKAGMEYNSELIAYAKGNIEKKTDLEGEILAIAHFPYVAYPDAPLVFVYVYKFESKKDAKAFYEDYAMQWTYARIEGNTVVYGTNDIIEDLEF